MKRRTILLISAVALAGCPAPSEQPPPSAEPRGAAAVQSSAPEPVPSKSALPSTPPAEPDAKAGDAASATEGPGPAASPTTQLHVIARAATSMMLHPLVDGSLLVSAGPLVMRVDDKGALHHDPKMLSGIQSIRGVSLEGEDFTGVSAWWPVALAGRWPDALYLSLDVVSGFRGEGGIPDVYRWNGQAWARLPAQGARYRWYPAEVHPWVEGSLLARRVFIPQPGKGETWSEDEGPTARQLAVSTAAIGKAKSIVVIRGAPKAPAMSERVSAFTSQPTGEVLLVDDQDPPNLVRIGADGARSSVALPGKGAKARGVLADGSGGAWAFGVVEGDGEARPWLVRVQGERATMAPMPECSVLGLASVAVLPSGAQWATCGYALDEALMMGGNEPDLWHRPAGGEWGRFLLPEGITAAYRVVAWADDDVWVAAAAGESGAILHSRPRTKVLELPDLPELGRQVIEWNDPLPVDDLCSFPYIPLRSAPADVAPVERALAGPIEALKLENSVVLVRTTLREREQLGLQVLPPFEEREVARVEAVVREALGEEAVDAARCWYAEEAQKAPLATWGGHS